MDSPYILGKPHNALDISFQINSGLYADQSQLNDLELDLDVFDEVVRQNDPFTTPLHCSKLLPSQELTPRPMNMELSQPTLPAKSSDNRTNAEPSDTSRRNIFLPQASKQSVSDDFFDVRKRNGDSHAGLDLTSKSTARLWKAKEKQITPAEFEAIVQSKLLPVPPKPVVEPTTVIAPTINRDLPIEEDCVTSPKKTAQSSRHPDIVKDAGVMKTKTAKPKSILKHSKPKLPSASTRMTEHANKSSRVKKEAGEKNVLEQNERRQSSGSLSSIGGGLMDVLMSYGEKIRNSLGLSSSIGPDELTQSEVVEEPSMKRLQSPPTTSSKMDTDTILPSPGMDPMTGSHPKETPLNDIEPLTARTSKKRLLPFSPGRERKRKCIQDENANTSGPNNILSYGSGRPADRMHDKGNIPKESISRPKPLRPSRSINKATEFTQSGRDDEMKSYRAKSSRERISVAGISTKRTISTRGISNSTTAADSQPMFASDVYRQMALEKAQKEQLEKQRAHFTKPVPPARPTLRPTIPAAFVFRSEERIVHRHVETEERHRSKTAQSHSDPHARPPTADSTTTRLAGVERKNPPNPVLTMTAPLTLNTMLRAKAREKFDNERREREKILEIQRLIRERERAEQEEKEYREARKRTIPRAHDVPEWYKEVSHKRNVAE